MEKRLRKKQDALVGDAKRELGIDAEKYDSDGWLIP